MVGQVFEHEIRRTAQPEAATLDLDGVMVDRLHLTQAWRALGLSD